MFGPITVPFEAKMLFNTVTLKPGFSFDEAEQAVGEMCMVVKETYGGDKGRFLAGQVFKFFGFISDLGSLIADRTASEHYAIVTYWRTLTITRDPMPTTSSIRSSPQLLNMCSETKELGYGLLWQGAM